MKNFVLFLGFLLFSLVSLASSQQGASVLTHPEWVTVGQATEVASPSFQLIANQPEDFGPRLCAWESTYNLTATDANKIEIERQAEGRYLLSVFYPSAWSCKGGESNNRESRSVPAIEWRI